MLRLAIVHVHRQIVVLSSAVSDQKISSSIFRLPTARPATRKAPPPHLVQDMLLLYGVFDDFVSSTYTALALFHSPTKEIPVVATEKIPVVATERALFVKPNEFYLSKNLEQAF